MQKGYPVDFYPTIKTSFLNFLFKDTEQNYLSKIAKLIQDNVNLRCTYTNDTYSYYYKGEHYFNKLLSPQSKQKILIKHEYNMIEIYPELRDELNQTINDYLVLLSEKHPIEIYLNQALLLCETLDDVHYLFPKKMCAHLPYVKEWRGVPYILDLPNITLTSEDIEKHEIEFKHLRGRMNARIVMNQLFNKI